MRDQIHFAFFEAVIELVDGARDMRFAMTAKTLANLPQTHQMNEITAKNVKKITRFRKNGMEELRNMVEKMREYTNKGWDKKRKLPAPKRVYLLEERYRREMHFPEEVRDWKLPNKNILQEEKKTSEKHGKEEVNAGESQNTALPSPQR